eukprot:6458813-Amphidinium_carterae.1
MIAQSLLVIGSDICPCFIILMRSVSTTDLLAAVRNKPRRARLLSPMSTSAMLHRPRLCQTPILSQKFKNY